MFHVELAPLGGIFGPLKSDLGVFWPFWGTDFIMGKTIVLVFKKHNVPCQRKKFQVRSIWLPRQTSSPSSNIDKLEETSREEKNNGIREKQSLLNMPLPRGWILNLMEGDHTFRVTFFRPSSIMWWRQGPNDWEMFVWKVGRAKTFSLIVVTTDGEVGLHVGAERAEMGRLSRQEAMMAAQTAFSPDPHKWELFSNKFPLFPPSLSHAAEAHQLVRSQSAVNILINVNTLYNRTWTD